MTKQINDRRKVRSVSDGCAWGRVRTPTQVARVRARGRMRIT
jgi:hypothetical protein